MSGGGYRTITFRQDTYVASRLVWIYHNGDIADNMTVDHIAEQEVGVSKLVFNSKDVNFISNLQLLTKSQQQRKSGNFYNKTTNLCAGIRRRKDRYSVSITVNGTVKSLGTFDTLEAAKLQRISSELEFWGESVTTL